MKISRSETHDRLEHFTGQSFDLGKTCQDIIDQRPYGEHPFYIFAHKREIGMDEKLAIFYDNPGMYSSLADVPTHRMIWQPRLTKPKAQINSMLFKAYPGSDVIKVIWLIPDPEVWEQFAKGKITENEAVSESIHLFKTDKEKLEAPEEDDLSDQQINNIYAEIGRDARRKKGKGETLLI